MFGIKLGSGSISVCLCLPGDGLAGLYKHYVQTLCVLLIV